MKRLVTLGVVLLVSVVCIAKKSIKQSDTQKSTAELEIEALRQELNEVRLKHEMDMKMLEQQAVPNPCQEIATSTDEYIAALGEGNNIDQQTAMMMARHNAIRNLTEELSINGYRIDSIPEVEVICNTAERDLSGNWFGYIAIKVKKSNLQQR